MDKKFQNGFENLSTQSLDKYTNLWKKVLMRAVLDVWGPYKWHEWGIWTWKEQAVNLFINRRDRVKELLDLCDMGEIPVDTFSDAVLKYQGDKKRFKMLQDLYTNFPIGEEMK